MHLFVKKFKKGQGQKQGLGPFYKVLYKKEQYLCEWKADQLQHIQNFFRSLRNPEELIMEGDDTSFCVSALRRLPDSMLSPT